MANVSFKDITSTIMFGNLTNDELNNVVEAVKYARAALAKKATWTFKKGDKVKYMSSKRGRMVAGVVEKVNIKYIIVNCGADGMWRVPANQLTAA